MTFTRALAKAFSLPKNVPQTAARGFGGSQFQTAAGTGGMDAYVGIGAAHGVLRRICEAVSLVDWALYEQSENPQTTERTLIDDATAPARHPATAIWTRPNPHMTRRQFLYLQQLWIETSGGCYWLMVQGGQSGSPFPRPGVTADFELWPIPAQRITPIADPDLYVSGYEYRYGSQRIPLPVGAVIPIGRPDPRDPLRFAGPLGSIGADLEGEAYAAQYNRNVFLNGAQPGGAIEFDSFLPQNRWEELVQRWREQHQGVNNAARVAIIEGGKWVDTSKSNQDMEYGKLREYAQDAVMFATGMPYGVMVTRDVNLANATIAQKIFYELSLRPRLEDVKEPLNERVLPLIADNLTMDFTLPSPQDAAFDVYEATSGWLAGLLTQNQALEALGYPNLGAEGDRYNWQITGTPPPMTPPKPPRSPTNLDVSDLLHRASAAEQPSGDTRCPKCDRWIGRRIPAGAEAFCPVHKGVVIP